MKILPYLIVAALIWAMTQSLKAQEKLELPKFVSGQVVDLETCLVRASMFLGDKKESEVNKCLTKYGSEIL